MSTSKSKTKIATKKAKISASDQKRIERASKTVCEIVTMPDEKTKHAILQTLNAYQSGQIALDVVSRIFK